MNELLQQRIQAVQIGRNTTFAQMEQKKSLREALESDVAAFLAKGGVVTSLKGTEYKERPPRSLCEVSEFASDSERRGLVKWVESNKAALRRNSLADVTGIPLMRVRYLVTNGVKQARMTRSEHKKFKDAIPVIEKMEMGL